MTDIRLEEQFEELLAGCTPAMQFLAHEARQLILSVQPDAHQEVHGSWGGYLLFRGAADAGNTVCWVTAHKKHVSIGFSQGNTLSDPAGLLEGGGKHSRHVKLKKPEDVARPELRALVKAAWADQPAPSVLQDALEKVRALCLALPETSETVSHGHPTFWAGKKTFAVYGLYSPSIAFKAGTEMHLELDGDARFSPTPYMAHGGWLSLRIDAHTDWEMARDLLRHSYWQVASGKLRKALMGGPGGTEGDSPLIRPVKAGKSGR
ncbi:MAG: hypothetical protein FJX76_21590 [Armatimonadetes bacterium]|nr:hypothetical protein [Armatimonadota bacterium]